MSMIVILDMEFLLPRGQAGPLVVPYIEYDKYSLTQ
jgi:hypothetical protein